MKFNTPLLLLSSNLLAVSATISWKDSVSRYSVDVLKNQHRKKQTDKFSKVHNKLKPAFGDLRDPAENPLTMDIPLDHFAPNAENGETFSNRYYVQDRYYKPGGPVIIHDIGEASIEPFAPGLVDEDEFSVQVAKNVSGLLILLEHRFYGESAPLTSVSRDLYGASRRELTEFFTYNTIEQGLEDVVYFANNFKYEFDNWPEQELTPEKVPWVWLGVSYSGSRGAWLAKRNPGLFKATLASSAPVQLKVNFWEYFTAVEANLAVSNKNCSADIHAMANWLSDVWQQRDDEAVDLVDRFIAAIYEPDWTELLAEYEGRSLYQARIWDLRRDFMQDAAWTAFADFQYFGVQGGSLGLFCELMETSPPNGATDEGVFANEDIETAVTAYAQAVSVLSPYSYTSGRQRADKIAKRQFSTGLDPQLQEYSWLWQVCTEFGAFQVSNMERPTNLIPSFINVTWQIEQCIEIFGESDLVSWAGPNVDPINNKYLGWNMELPNTLWVNGEYDPWKALSLDSTEEDAPTNDTATTEVPRCGASFEPGEQLRYVIKNGYHGSEFSEQIAGAENPNLDDLNPTNTLDEEILSTTRSRRTSSQILLTGTPIPDVTNAHSLWFSALNAWVNCTTLPYTYTPAGVTTSTPASSRTPFPTGGDGSNNGNNNDGDDENAGVALVIPGVLIPFLTMCVAFVAGLRMVL